MRIAFFKPDMAWPRTSGHDVHTYHMMRALGALGCELALATRRPAVPESVAGVSLAIQVAVGDREASHRSIHQTSLEARFQRYWGIPASEIAGFGEMLDGFRPDVVVVSGLEVLPFLTAAPDDVTRVWYAADEWVWHHLSQVTPTRPATWAAVREAVVKGLYERTFRRRLDRVWVVSPSDARAMRLVTGVTAVDVLPNGVDSDRLCPRVPDSPEAETAIFWGRLDFGPNVQALEWFCDRVWPLVRLVHPAARFTIVGFNPTRAVVRLAEVAGVELRPNAVDIAHEAARCAVVVLPFVSGGGIKNKLLEAAALGKAVVCTPRTLGGLRGDPPLQAATRPAEWVSALTRYWTDDGARRTAGQRARAWVEREHTWEATARLALERLSARPTVGSVG